MAKFQYNWATAEMVKLFLRNSRSQAKRKVRKAIEATLDTPVNPGLVVGGSGTGTGAGHNGAAASLGEDSESDDSDNSS